MLINCNSCQKKFAVPDSAIPVSGRLVQCSACGNKWTAYPVVKKKEIETKKLVKKSKVKKTTRIQKLKKVDKYSEEYLMKKHGLQINENKKIKKVNNKKNKTIAELDDKNSGFGFYGYLIFIIVFVVMFFGVLNLSKDYIVSLYPLSAVYIDYLYEVVDIIKTIILQLLNQF